MTYDCEIKRLLPEHIYAEIERLNPIDLNEIRLRVHKPTVLMCRNKIIKTAIVCEKNDLNTIVFRAANFAVYSVESEIACGYITTNAGIRIGIAGEAVKDKTGVISIRNYYSLNIRIPSEVKGCALKLYNSVKEKSNILIVSPPGRGKTTLLRDYARMLSEEGQNVLIVDEKYEIAAVSSSGYSQYDLSMCDIISGFSKNYGFSHGIRYMHPDVIATDELALMSDIDGAISAIYSGVNVVATMHGSDIKSLSKSKLGREIVQSNLFGYYVEIVEDFRYEIVRGGSYG